MRSLFAALRTLVLPAGATTGPRIVLNGLAGVIEIYNAAGQLYATIDPTTGFTSFDPAAAARYVRLSTDPVEGPFLDFGQSDAAIAIQGYIQQYITGAPGGGRNLVLEASPGKFTTSADCRLLLTSESEDGTELSLVNVIAGDLQLNSATISRGLVQGASFVSTSNSAGFTGDATSDMVALNVPVIGGHTYRIHLHTMALLSAAGEWALNVEINAATVIGRAGYIDLAASGRQLIDGAVYWTPAASGATDDVRIVVDELAGAATLTLEANATIPRSLTIEHIGIL